MIAQMFQSSALLLIVALGGLVAERSGILNIGLEGMITVGAFVAVAARVGGASPAVAVGLAALAGVIPALLTGKFDVIIGGMGILPKRNLKVNFSMPYDYSGMSIVANRELAAGFASLEDFNRPDVVLSVRLGATPVDAAKKHMPKAQLRMFDDESQAVQEVVNGKAHAMVSSAPLPTFQALKYPEKLFLPLQETFTKEPIGFAVRKGDFDTLNFFNNWIIVVTSEGWLKERKHYWFETKEWESRIR